MKTISCDFCSLVITQNADRVYIPFEAKLYDKHRKFITFRFHAVSETIGRDLDVCHDCKRKAMLDALQQHHNDTR